MPRLKSNDALLVVDIQKDFLPGGSLPVPKGDRVIAPLNEAMRRFRRARLPIVASRDWHPPGHVSFRERGGPWPPHCVAGTPGAEFDKRLELPPGIEVFSKATQRDREAYSALDGTGLGRRLKELGIHRIFIGGLTTEYCVLTTTRDALAAGFEVWVLEDAIGAIDARPGDGARALSEIRHYGATLIRSEELTPHPSHAGEKARSVPRGAGRRGDRERRPRSLRTKPRKTP